MMDSTRSSWLLLVRLAGCGRLGFAYAEGGNHVGHATEFPLPPSLLAVGAWHHVAVVHETRAATLAVYIDGAEIGVRPSPAANDGRRGSLRIGRDRYEFGPCGDAFPGVLDDLYIYDRALGVSEVASLASQ